MANVLTMPVFSIYEEGAPKLSKIKHIFLFLTLLSLKVIFKDGQITPNTVTHPLVTVARLCPHSWLSPSDLYNSLYLGGSLVLVTKCSLNNLDLALIC